MYTNTAKVFILDNITLLLQKIQHLELEYVKFRGREDSLKGINQPLIAALNAQDKIKYNEMGTKQIIDIERIYLKHR
jgi:hypothetical protein